MNTVLSTRSSRHHLTVGPLRHTPLGAYTQEQLESAKEVVTRALDEAIKANDEAGMKRLTTDADELRAELERRRLSAA